MPFPPFPLLLSYPFLLFENGGFVGDSGEEAIKKNLKLSHLQGNFLSIKSS